MIDLTVVEDAEAAARTCAERVAEARSSPRAPRAASRTSRSPAAARPRAPTSCWRSAWHDWRDVHLWFGDERCVPLDDPDSNHALLARTLLANLPAGTAPPLVHALPGAGDGDPAAAAAAYERELRDTVPGDPPKLDLALLGLGEDGHTASLFPDDPVLEERERLCVAVRGRKPPPDRVTLTLPVLRAARAIVVLTAGAGKAAAVAAMLAGPSRHVPASLLGDGATVELIADRAAAAA